MNTGLISSRYALALYEFAQQQNAEDRVYDEAKLLAKSFVKFNDLRPVLDNPVLGKTQKKQIILLAMSNAVDAVFDKFLDLVLEKNRETQIQTITLKYIDLYRKRKNIYPAKLTIASDVDELTEKRLVAVVEKETHGTLEIEKFVDPAILGGFVLEVNNVRWDASVAGQLDKIKKTFMEQNIKTS